ncbi:hypothetical protein GA0074692_0024 [Micromonospora pallida]|uniref:Uncharacterized protein n=1 Tax=Micromonospora pallida TaxID=145854 RepID=A0A1C6RGX3_9ACTN|nr:hypothetical protein [Micromonospora pallida]SCL16415.1 hypothetical protein GA0074692_0024 [Micromonospora pallida]
MRCDVCGLPDPYAGQGDGIGSCDCPRCDHGCGVARGSYLCSGDDGICDCEEYDCAGECCGIGNCTCTPDDDQPWPDDVIQPVVTIQPSGAHL